MTTHNAEKKDSNARRTVGTPRANSCSTRFTGSLATQPYHPHIQHADLGVTSVYLRGIDNTEIIDTVHGRRPPMMPAGAGLLIGR
jgi:hypothetical protein